MTDSPSLQAPLVLAITGASGAVYAMRLLEVLLERGSEVHLMMSPSGAAVVKQELGRNIDVEKFELRTLLPAIEERAANRIRYHHYQDYFAPVASGSFLTGGMV